MTVVEERTRAIAPRYGRAPRTDLSALVPAAIREKVGEDYVPAWERRAPAPGRSPVSRTPSIDPDDLAFMATTGVGLAELAARVGIKPESLWRHAKRHRIAIPRSWESEHADALAERQRDRKRDHMRRKRAGMPMLPQGAVKRPDDCCPYCPTQRTALPAEQLLWAMRGGPHCGRVECYRGHERARYAARRRRQKAA